MLNDIKQDAEEDMVALFEPLNVKSHSLERLVNLLQ